MITTVLLLSFLVQRDLPMATLKETEADLRLRVLLVASDVVDDEDRIAALEVLAAGGKTAIPLLIEKLAALAVDDVEFPPTRVETGPLNPGPPMTMATTARFQIERVLYRIVTPQRRPPEKTNALDALRPDHAPVPARTPLLYIDDWSAFWTTHKSESIEQMRAFADAEVERRWAALVKGERPTTMTTTTTTAATVHPHHSDAAAVAERAAWSELRDAFEAARRQPAARPGAVKVLKANKSPALKPHVTLMLQALGEPVATGAGGR